MSEKADELFKFKNDSTKTQDNFRSQILQDWGRAFKTTELILRSQPFVQVVIIKNNVQSILIFVKMARKFDQIVVIDLEATCWEKSKDRPKNETNDIIEIGICLLDVQTRKRAEKHSILVKPQRSRVSDFCTKLTTLTQEQVDRGILFADACKMLRDRFHSKQRVWASYGEYDRNQLQKQSQEMDIAYPFGTRHINVKTLLAIAHQLPQEVGMGQALELLNLPLEGTHHRGGDDAWNIAAILAVLLWNK